MATLVVLAVLAAGCAGQSPAAAGSEPGDDPLQAPDAGTLYGVVVDDAVRPVGAVHVSVGDTATTRANATTGPDGMFRFEGLSPGAYVVDATKEGYTPSRVAAQLTGDALAPALQVVLTPIPGLVPYVLVTKFEGYILCAANVLPACAFAADVAGAAGADDAVSQRSSGNGPIDAAPAFIQGELYWTTTNSGFPELFFNVGAEEPGAGWVQPYGPAKGPSPLVVTAAPDPLSQSDFNTSLLAYLVSSGGAFPTPPSVTMQQSFTVILTATYGFRPPEGWTYGNDGEPLPPR